MSEIVVYHGGTEVVTNPICKLGRPNLDFGQGFYVTDLREQALSWAMQMADNRKKAPVLNRYRLNREAILAEARCKVFTAYDEAWLEFIVASSRGLKVAENFDYIEGGVANDNVIDTVEDYIRGRMSSEAALVELSKHQPNNQICILSQEVIDKHLHFVESLTL